MTEHRLLYIPIELSELLHSTLGPLSDVLEREGHHWAPMVQKVIREYTARRDQILVHLHGSTVIPAIAHHTYLAAERVCELTKTAVREEEDFLKWANEVGGESA